MNCTVRLLLTWVLLMTVQFAQAHKPYADAHVHLVDFFQRSSGAQALIKHMDAGGVAHAAVMGLPMMKMWSMTEPKEPRYVFGDDAKVYWYSLTDEIVARAVKSLPPEQRRRLHPFINGFNPTDQFAVEHIERMLEWHPDFWEGIGEIMTRHDDLTAYSFGAPARANHPALFRVYELAAKHDLPVLIHSNITSVRMREPLYLAEFEEALRCHPNTRFIWAHAGTSKSINRRITLTFLHDQVARLLSTYQNLWIDLSWAILDDYLLTDEKRLSRRWLKIIQRFPNRFLLGSDVVGSFTNMGKKLAEFDVLLDALDEEHARMLAHDNFFAVLPKRAGSLPSTGVKTPVDPAAKSR